MRKIVIGVVIVLALVAVVVLIGNRNEPTPGGPTATPTRSAAASDTDDLQELLETRLTTRGSQVFVGIPATVTIDDVSGKTVYARVTVQELGELPEVDAADVLAQSEALGGYSTVYTMPVELTVLGIVDVGGLSTAPGVEFSAATLSRVSIATHPGSEPVPSSNTLTSAGCPGLPASSAIKTGQTLQWCVHAFGDDNGNPPTGGQYQTLTGDYENPVTWASQIYAAPTIP